jgi:hypothetical protein
MKEKIENFSQKIRREDNKHKQNFIQKFWTEEANLES